MFGVDTVKRVRECIGSQGVAALDTILAGRISHLVDKLHGEKYTTNNSVLTFVPASNSNSS